MTGYRSLSPQQVSQYSSEGYTYPIEILTADEVREYRASLARVQEELRREDPVLLLTNLHLSFRWAYELATHSRVLDAVRDLMGPDVVIYSTLVFAKSGGESKYVSWHQDGRFLLRTPQPMNALTAWIALTPSTVENGCLMVVPGSHGAGRLPHVNTFAPHNMLLRGETIEGDFEAVSVVLAPGEMSVHHVDTVHGSNPNCSGDPRIGFTVRYVHPDVTPVDGNTIVIPLHEGESKSGPPLCPTGGPADEVSAHLAWVKRTRAAIAAKEG